MRRSIACLMFMVPAMMPAAVPEVHMTVPGSRGLVEIIPELAEGYGQVDGARGCADGLETCVENRQIMAIRSSAMPGETMSIHVAGDAPAGKVRITRGDDVVFEQDNVALPFEFQVGTLSASEKVAVAVSEGEESVQFSAQTAAKVSAAGKLAPRAVTGVSIYNYVQGPGSYWYQIIEGSRTGGRFVNGYTDRAQRGELIETDWFATGCSNHIGWTYDGSHKTIESHQCFDSGFYYQQMRVSTNPNDDYLYAIADSVRSHIPIGTR